MHTQINLKRVKLVDARNFFSLFCILFFCFFLNFSEAKTIKSKDGVVLYPQVANLERVKGISESNFFDLSVNGKNAFVYHSKEVLDQYEHIKQLKSISYQGVSYVNFSMKKKVKLQINTFNSKASNWKVFPNRSDLQIDPLTNSISFTLNKPEKFVVSAVINGVEQSIIISAEKPEKNIPLKSDKGVLFLAAARICSRNKLIFMFDVDIRSAPTLDAVNCRH